MHAIVAKYQKNSVHFVPLPKKIIVPCSSIKSTNMHVYNLMQKLRSLKQFFLYLSERQMGELAEEGVRPGVCASARMLMVGFAEKCQRKTQQRERRSVG